MFFETLFLIKISFCLSGRRGNSNIEARVGQQSTSLTRTETQTWNKRLEGAE